MVGSVKASSRLRNVSVENMLAKETLEVVRDSGITGDEMYFPSVTGGCPNNGAPRSPIGGIGSESSISSSPVKKSSCIDISERVVFLGRMIRPSPKVNR